MALWMCKLGVDLSSGDHHVEDLSDAFVRTYLGGAGFTGRVLSDEIGTDVDPLDPDVDPLDPDVDPLDPNAYARELDRYYVPRGWLTEGVSLRETLLDLDLPAAADDVGARTGVAP